MKRRLGFAALLVLVLAGVALARPGGGESFSGGGGHSSGGGGGGVMFVFELVYWLLRLILYYPQVGVPIVIGVIVLVVWSGHQKRQNRDWDSGPPVAPQRAVPLEAVRTLDPDFSSALFEDFAFRLFSAAHRARGSEASLAAVAPYVSAEARASLAAREPTATPIAQVIVGAMRVVDVDVPYAATDAEDKPAREQVTLELEANVITAEHTYYSVETWTLGRDATRTSKPPGASKDFPCPNCGAPWQTSATGTQQCASCREIVDNGRFDWSVEDIALTSQDVRPPSLTAEVPERGTDLATYREPDADARWADLAASDPALTSESLDARLAMIYAQLNTAWASNELAPARGLVSDGLYDYLQYWVDAYKRQGLRNALVDMRIVRSELAKVVRDRWYDAVTIRIWGTGKDYVLATETGRILRGSKHAERAYSEYWTLIRSASRKGVAKAQPTCGNCGAPLHITMAGACEHCGAHITAGEFDWVLSKIEQDDTYRG